MFFVLTSLFTLLLSQILTLIFTLLITQFLPPLIHTGRGFVNNGPLRQSLLNIAVIGWCNKGCCTWPMRRPGSTTFAATGSASLLYQPLRKLDQQNLLCLVQQICWASGLWSGLPELLIWGFSLQGRKNGVFCFQIRKSCGNKSWLFLHPLPKKLKSVWPWL